MVLPAKPANATVAYAGSCVTTATLSGGNLILTGSSCVYVPNITGGLSGTGAVVPSASLGMCNIGALTSEFYTVTAASTSTGTLNVLNTGNLTIEFLSSDLKLSLVGELAPVPPSTCPTSWTGVLVVEDPSVD